MWTNKLNLRGLQIRKLVDKTYFPIFLSSPLPFSSLLCHCFRESSRRVERFLSSLFVFGVVTKTLFYIDISLVMFNLVSRGVSIIHYPTSASFVTVHRPPFTSVPNEKSRWVRLTNREPSCVLLLLMSPEHTGLAASQPLDRRFTEVVGTPVNPVLH